jgi:hypothetical protein
MRTKDATMRLGAPEACRSRHPCSTPFLNRFYRLLPPSPMIVNDGPADSSWRLHHHHYHHHQYPHRSFLTQCFTCACSSSVKHPICEAAAAAGTSAYPYASPSHAWLSRFVLGRVPRASESRVPWRKPPSVCCILVVWYA